MRVALVILLMVGAVGQAPGSTPFLAAQTPSQWQQFSHAAGRFSVLVPGVLVAQAPTSDQAGTYYSFTLSRPSGALVVVYNDATYDMTEPQVELNSARDAFVKSLEASVVSEHRFTSTQPIGPVPASEFTCQSAQWECKARTFMLGRRGYMLAVLNRRGMGSAIDTDRFLDSFQILPAR